MEDFIQAVAGMMQQVVRQEINNAVQQICDAYSKQKQQSAKSELTTTEAARYLGIKWGTLVKKANRHEIPFTKQGRELYFKRSELDAYMMANYIPPTENY